MAALGWLLLLGFAGGSPAESAATTYLRGTVTVYPSLDALITVMPSLDGAATVAPALNGRVTVGDA